VLLSVLVLFFAIYFSVAAFLWFMSGQQTQAGARYRDAAALSAAEAGIQRALALLESPTEEPLSPTARLPLNHTEPISMGSLSGDFTISVAAGGDGSFTVTSVGAVAGRMRRLEARVTVASPALLAGLYAASVVQFERPSSRAVIAPYNAKLARERWVHVMAGEAIRFIDVTASIINGSAGVEFLRGPLSGPDDSGRACSLGEARTARLAMPRGAELTIGREFERVGAQDLRTMGYRVEEYRTAPERFPAPPRIDRGLYTAMAAANNENAGLNRAAGEFSGDRWLARKLHSVYAPHEASDILRYAAFARSRPVLRGVVYVTGGVELAAGRALAIEDGSLVAERNLVIGEGAELVITHTPRTRTLPGLLILDEGGLLLDQRSRLNAHGLVYVSRSVEMGEGAAVDVVGALLAAHPYVAVRSDGGRLGICYDQAVLGTPGLTVGPRAPVIAWVSDWKEVAR
jgi:hypothetical protein